MILHAGSDRRGMGMARSDARKRQEQKGYTGYLDYVWDRVGRESDQRGVFYPLEFKKVQKW